MISFILKEELLGVFSIIIIILFWLGQIFSNHVIFRLLLSFQALVDAPDMVRTQMNFKRLSLTDIKIDIKRIPKKKTLIQAMQEAGGLNHLLLQNLKFSQACSGCFCCFSVSSSIMFDWQMSKVNGQRALGAGSLLFKRRGHALMTLIDLSSCWPKSRFVSIALAFYYTVKHPNDSL